MPCAGGHLKDAVGVCAHELADPQLAIFVARLLEPEQGALLGNLLANELLPRKTCVSVEQHSQCPRLSAS